MTTLKRAGGSLVMTVPARARDALGLSDGDVLSVSVEDDKLVLEPASPARPRYTLAQLLAEERAAKIKPGSLEDWTDAPPKGREIW
jgi:antitoxin ChpS